MSKSRDNFINIVTAAFLNPETKAKCLNTCKNISQHAIAARAFDEFPCLLPEIEINQLKKEFLGILRNAKPSPFSDAGYQLIEYKDIRAVETLEKKIAAIGYAELIDVNTQKIKDSIIKLLEWDKDKINLCDILCAYVGAINQDILHGLLSDIEKHNDTFTACCSHITKNYHLWAAEVLKLHGHVVESAPARINLENNSAYLYKSINRQDIAIGAAAASILVTGLLSGFFLFNQVKNRRKNKSHTHNHAPSPTSMPQ